MEIKKLARRVATVFQHAFGPTSYEGRLQDIRNEFEELCEAKTQNHREEEFGDVLTSLLKYGEEQGFDPEKVIVATLDKIKKRVGENYYKTEDAGSVNQKTPVQLKEPQKPKKHLLIEDDDNTAHIAVGKNAARTRKETVKPGTNLKVVEETLEDYEVVANIDTTKRS